MVEYQLHDRVQLPDHFLYMIHIHVLLIPAFVVWVLGFTRDIAQVIPVPVLLIV